ncbi:aldose epimerase family protein, partial [Staphylococcus aureus]
LHASVRYAVEDDALVLDYAARAEAVTVVGLTNHAYFNLDGGGDVLGHVLAIPAERFTSTDAAQIPTGELRSVAGTAFDFRTPHAIGARIGGD